MKKIVHWLVILATLFLNTALAQTESDEPLEIEKAFRSSFSLKNGTTLVAEWFPAEGYYLYRDKFRFTAVSKEVELGTPLIPPGVKKKDPLFGEVETFRKHVVIEVPFKSSLPATQKIEIDVLSQGCADLGLCYPPYKLRLAIDLLTKTISVTPIAFNPATDIVGKPPSVVKAAVDPVSANPVSPAPQSTTPAKDPLKAVRALDSDLGLSAEQKFLNAEDAFKLSVSALDASTLKATWTIAEGYYLYRDKMKFTLMNTTASKNPKETVKIGAVSLPAGQTKNDPILGKVEVYYKSVEIRVPLDGTFSQPLTVQASFQGCADVGLCYPVTTQKIEFSHAPGNKALARLVPEVKAAITAATVTPSLTLTVVTPTQTQTDQTVPPSVGDDENSFSNKMLKAVMGTSPVSAILALAVLGLMVAFTACMYPMIPIVAAIVIGQGEKISVMRGFLLALAYVLAIGVVFGVIGALFGIAGKSLEWTADPRALAQDLRILVPTVVFLVLLALSMFGLYTLQMPASIQSRLTQFSNQQKSGSYVGAALMGGASSLIIGPCGGPYIAAAFLAAFLSKSMLLGFVYLFVFGIGMGLPMLAVGAFGGSLLPRAGRWMDTIKHAGGVVILFVALVVLDQITGQLHWYQAYMLVWALFLVVLSVYFGAFERLPEKASGWRSLWKALGIALFLWGLLVAIGGLTGGRFPSDPFRGSSLIAQNSPASNALISTAAGPKNALLQGKSTKQKGQLTFVKVKTLAELQAQIQNASRAGFTVMLDFYADWCTYCIQYDYYVFNEASVKKALENTLLLEVDVTKMDDQDKEILKHFRVPTPPAILFFDKQGKETGKRIYSFMDYQKFLQHLQITLGD